MPQLLISVTSKEEAIIALENGADIIDLKDPHAGALGALSYETIFEITHFINQQKLVSATIGDLPMDTNMDAKLIFNAVEKLVLSGVDFIKIGFFVAKDYQAILNRLKPLADAGVNLIAVLFAENNYADKLINDIKNAGFVGIMLDTAEKNGKTFLDYYSSEKRLNFCQNVLRLNLKLGLAGSLNIQHVENIKALKPSYIGFRGGVCEMDKRTAKLDGNKIKALCKLL